MAKLRLSVHTVQQIGIPKIVAGTKLRFFKDLAAVRYDVPRLINCRSYRIDDRLCALHFGETQDGCVLSHLVA